MSHRDTCPGKPGDLLVFKRKAGYSHYAVCVGDGYIIHATSVSDDHVGSGDVRCCFSASNIAMIKKEKYSSNFVKSGDRVEVENGSWRGRQPLPVEEIIKRAESKIGTREYSVLWNNCEHFARWCRYGEETSDQADGLIQGAAAAAVGATALGGLLYAFAPSSKNKDKTSRQ